MIVNSVLDQQFNRIYNKVDSLGRDSLFMYL